jgi:hypothetical protein
VLGTIFAGVASPTEAAGVGAVGALAWRGPRQAEPQDAREVTESTARLTSMIFIILVGATAFGLVFRGLGGDHMVRDFIAGLPFDKWGVLAVIMALIFVMGFFLDFIEITFIQVPVVAPLLVEAGVRPRVAGADLRREPQTSFLTRPSVSRCSTSRACARGVSTGAIYKGIIPFVLFNFWCLRCAWLSAASAVAARRHALTPPGPGAARPRTRKGRRSPGSGGPSISPGAGLDHPREVFLVRDRRPGQPLGHEGLVVVVDLRVMASLSASSSSTSADRVRKVSRTSSGKETISTLPSARISARAGRSGCRIRPA